MVSLTFAYFSLNVTRSLETKLDPRGRSNILVQLEQKTFQFSVEALSHCVTFPNLTKLCAELFHRCFFKDFVYVLREANCLQNFQNTYLKETTRTTYMKHVFLYHSAYTVVASFHFDSCLYHQLEFFITFLHTQNIFLHILFDGS